MRRTLLLLATAAAPAAAQSAVAVSLARMHTPGGALSSLAFATLGEEGVRLGPGAYVHFGVARRPGYEIPGESAVGGLQETVWGVSADLPVSPTTRLGAGAGRLRAPCPTNAGCDHGSMAGVSLRSTLRRAELSPAHGARYVGISLAADAGAGRLGATAIAASVGTPFWIAAYMGRGSPAMEADLRLRPHTVFFVTPTLVAGRLGAQGRSSTGAMGELSLGASVLGVGRGFGATVVVRKGFAEASRAGAAVGFSWHAAH
jgi:hypothetical protein